MSQKGSRVKTLTARLKTFPLCSRRQGAVFCEYAQKYHGYQVDPPKVTYEGAQTATEDVPVSVVVTGGAGAIGCRSSSSSSTTIPPT